MPRSFDVTKFGEYLGMPRIEEQIIEMYERLGIDTVKLRVD